MNPEEEDEDDVMMSLPPQDETSNSNNGSVHAEQTCEEMDFNQGCLHKVELLKKPEQMNNLNGHGIQPEMIQNGEQSKPQVDSVGEDKISVEQNRTTEKGLDCETVALIQAGAGEDKEIALEETEEMAPGQDLAVDPITENNMGEANGSSTEDASTSESQNLTPLKGPVSESKDNSPKSLNEFSDSESDDDDRSSTSSKSQEGVPAKKAKLDPERKQPAGLRRHQELRRTMVPFVQRKPCEKLSKHRLGKCLECTLAARTHHRLVGRRGNKDASVCRFYSFRKLRYNDRGSLIVAGYPDSETDHASEDLKLWTPNADYSTESEMSLDMAKFLLTSVGDQFCELVKQERAVKLDLNQQESKIIIWRRPVQDLRELCDVCSTTLFNYHWTCGRCGFVVCISCFSARKNISDKESDENEDDVSNNDKKDAFGWLKCHREEHEFEKLLLTQIIAGNALDMIWERLHTIRGQLNIPQECGCQDVRQPTEHLIKLATPEKTDLMRDREVLSEPRKDTSSNAEPPPIPMALEKDEPDETDLEDVVHGDSVQEKSTADSNKTTEASDEDESDDDGGGLFDLFSGAPEDPPQTTEVPEADMESTESSLKTVESSPQNEPTSAAIDKPLTETTTWNGNGSSTDLNTEVELKHFVRSESRYTIKVLPKHAKSLSQTEKEYPNVPHTWLCRGLLLRLLDPTNAGNLELFQHQWKRGLPVIVSNVAGMLDQNMWSPESFSKDFGHKTSNFINCMTGKVVPNQRLKKFWDGFDSMRKRLRDDDNIPMLLKLKDWPPADDFAKMSPERFKDLMSVLPVGEYTYRDGKLNLAARLPSTFSRPDLGPKMYIAYGSGLHLEKGTTNLHLDVSDAVNVMVHVGVVKDEDITEHKKAVEKAVDESDCDQLTINRVLKGDKELPGALWHIWEPKDADKIRDMLNKIALEERGVKVEAHHDAIHDQTWYLDRKLRKRLMEEYNVIGYPIVQCAGDAVFIPAGAPHQVRNLNNCIKIAEDFVSPENVRHCFHLTEEFRNLTETHTNHEDKLQIKNVVYHTVKDAISVIEASLKKND